MSGSLACCLALGGFTSPAAAHHIVVTTLIDTADPPFNVDCVCGTGASKDLPAADIVGEGGGASGAQFPMPNAGTGNVLTGEIAKNTATTMTVANRTPGNTATVTQFKNDPCP